MFQEYTKVSKYDMIRTIEHEMSGDLKAAFKVRGCAVLSPCPAWRQARCCMCSVAVFFFFIYTLNFSFGQFSCQGAGPLCCRSPRILCRASVQVHEGENPRPGFTSKSMSSLDYRGGSFMFFLDDFMRPLAPCL